MIVNPIYAALGAGVFVLLYAAYLVVAIMSAPRGTSKMNAISDAILEGANAFLKRQYITLVPFVVVIFVALLLLANNGVLNEKGPLAGMQTPLGFLCGVVSSALAGCVGMMVSVRANVRVAEGAKTGMARALDLAFKGGGVTGMALIGLGLVFVSALYWYFGTVSVLIGFGFGASLISLFSRVGGGIFTKAADVGADLVGKIEKGIPEDDPRNPAVIADNVGDNVGDCAGMAADVYESFVVTIIAAMLIGTAISPDYATYPLLLAAIGGIAGVFGSFFVSIGKDGGIMNAFYKGIFVTCGIMAVVSYFAIQDMALFVCALVGTIVTPLMFWISEYYTGKDHKPVQDVANAATTGAGTNLIAGLAIGMQSTALPTLVIILAIAVSFHFAGIYGVAIAAAAMLSLSGIVIAIDSYGPITDNAGGIAEMSGLPEKVRTVTDELDAVGNTTKATTKGFAIAGAALGALALFSAFAAEAKITSVDLLSPAVTIGLFAGALMPFLFSSFLMTAVGRAAFFIVEEVRRQFREIKGLMSGKAKPDYARAVDISTSTALNELMLPGAMAVLTPLFVGFVLGPAALAGLLAGAIASGFLMALFMSNAGAAWDNAKKYIEMGNYGGKGSDAHKAAVVGDTVGDPFKDTAGPALNALIKVVNTVSLAFAPLIIAYGLKLML
jgi:K(+)-stimulated pyrophosphate-energized sodium pump